MDTHTDYLSIPSKPRLALSLLVSMLLALASTLSFAQDEEDEKEAVYEDVLGEMIVMG
jgi:hypothetical protein